MTGFNQGRDSRERISLENKKIAAETRAVLLQISRGTRTIEWIKAIAGMAGVLTAIGALVGVYLAVEKARVDSNSIANASRREQMNSSISLIADSNPAKQLAGIASINTFFESENSQGKTQLIALMSSILAVEKNQIVRDAIVSFLKAKFSQKLDAEVIDDALTQMANLSAALVSEGDLVHSREGNKYGRIKPASVEARALSISEVIQVATKYSRRPLRLNNIYCVGCDLTRLTLDKADFSNSILYLADFSNSSLRGATFEGADLQETRFVAADLREAKFTFNDNLKSNKVRSSYAKIFSEKTNWDFHGPDFSCADLRNADFSGHPIYAIGLPDQKYFLTGGTFVGADLQGTSLGEAEIFGKAPGDPRMTFTSSGGGSIENGVISFVYKWANYRVEIAEDYVKAFDAIAREFAGSNWKEARLPVVLQSFFDTRPPPSEMEFSFRATPCTPKAREGFSPKINLTYRKSLSKEEVKDALDGDPLGSLANLALWKMRKRGTMSASDATLLTLWTMKEVADKGQPSRLQSFLTLSNEERRSVISSLPNDLTRILQESERFIKSVPRPGELSETAARKYYADLDRVLVSQGIGLALVANKDLILLTAKKFVATNRTTIEKEFQEYVMEK